MKALRFAAFLFFLLVTLKYSIPGIPAEKPGELNETTPKTWDDAAMATLEVPLANPVGSPKQATSAYYYSFPVRPIYKSYPVYAPGREPKGYIEWLKTQEPEIVWDDKGHQPPLKTEADWIKAGELVFDAPIGYGGTGGTEPTDLYVRDSKYLQETNAPVAGDGTLPFFRYVVEKKGKLSWAVSRAVYAIPALCPMEAF